jgi:hypothetical protein
MKIKKFLDGKQTHVCYRRTILITQLSAIKNNYQKEVLGIYTEKKRMKFQINLLTAQTISKGLYLMLKNGKRSTQMLSLYQMMKSLRITLSGTSKATTSYSRSVINRHVVLAIPLVLYR